MTSKPKSPAIEWIEREVAVADLKPYERNPRRISKEAFARLVSDLRLNGYHQRIIATPDLRVIGGHQRIKALQEIGLERVKVLTPNRDIPPAQFREMLVKDNLPFGEFDFDMLSADFEPDELIEWGMPAEWLQLPDGGEEGNTDPDEVPAVAAAPISVRGDVWLLGDHRIMCGDSTSATDVETLLDGNTPHLMVTDPPYGVEYDASWRVGHDKNIGKKIGGKNQGGRALGKVQNDDRADWREAWDLFPGDVAYVWHGGLHSAEVQQSLEAAGFKMRAQIIWAKQHFVFGRGDYHWQHEPCWYAVRERSKGHYNGDRKQTTLWEINNNNPFGNGGETEEKTNHSTQKPVECMKRPIENNSKPGDSIYEPFSGSGTTIIAAEMTGRRALAMEIDPLYIDMAVKRWQNYTGKEALHAETGQRFNSRV